MALIVLVAGWAFTSLRNQSYSGTALDFGVGHGPVTVTNLSDAPIPVQLASTGTRSFRVLSTTEGIAGASVREGSGQTASHLFNFVLPTGVSSFTVTGGSDVRFLSTASTPLTAMVQSASDGEARTTLIAAAVVILGALFYLWRTTGQRSMSAARRQRVSENVARQTTMNADLAHGQGREIRAYGDNRTS